MGRFRLTGLPGDILPPVLALVALLLLWEGMVAAFSIPRFVLPAPSFIYQSGTSIASEIWIGHVTATLRVVLTGFSISVLIAIPLAMLFVALPFVSRAIYPLVVVVQCMPVISVAPIIIVVFGTSETSRVIITALIAFFPIIVAAVGGMLSTPAEMIELSRSLRARRYREVLGVRFPHALPQIFGALKISITLSVIGATVAEFVAADAGLGYMIMLNTSFLRMGHAFAALAVLIALSLLLFWIVVLLERRVLYWVPGR